DERPRDAEALGLDLHLLVDKPPLSHPQGRCADTPSTKTSTAPLGHRGKNKDTLLFSSIAMDADFCGSGGKRGIRGAALAWG
ncbi:hypothetical protein DRJ27_05215, partial [Candidatus Acetothermia bacterium]